MDSFSQLGLAPSLAEALASFGFAAPTPVQAATIPAILSRRDAIVESETGTGKTFAYLAPAFQLVSTLARTSPGEPLALVAAPTQELAVQIGREAERLAKAASLPARTVVLLGGTPLEKQAAKLKAKPEIVVGTLGRLADLVALGRLRTSGLKLLVLDEADRLFAPETADMARALLQKAPSQAVKVLVSATIPEKIRREMRPFLREAEEICPVGEKVLSAEIEHWCFYCDGRKRLDFVRRFEAAVHPARCLLFLTMASRVEKAAAALAHLGIPIEAIHSGLDKEARRVALERFSEGEVRYLLTSDLGARGLDIPGISHVISLDLPEEPTIYTHRAGRTGRAGATGVSVVLADGIELARASKIAVKGGFVFRCKVLEERQVLEPTSEEFFARASAAETERMEAKAKRVGDGETRGANSKRGPRRDSRPRGEGYGEGRRGEFHRGHDRPLAIEDDPTEGPRTAKPPASAPWRPAEGPQSKAPEGTRGEPRRFGEARAGGGILRKKASLRDEAPKPESRDLKRRRDEGEGGKSRPPFHREGGDAPRRARAGETQRDRSGAPYTTSRSGAQHTTSRSDAPRGPRGSDRRPSSFDPHRRGESGEPSRVRREAPRADKPRFRGGNEDGGAGRRGPDKDRRPSNFGRRDGRGPSRPSSRGSSGPRPPRAKKSPGD